MKVNHRHYHNRENNERHVHALTRRRRNVSLADGKGATGPSWCGRCGRWRSSGWSRRTRCCSSSSPGSRRTPAAPPPASTGHTSSGGRHNQHVSLCTNLVVLAEKEAVIYLISWASNYSLVLSPPGWWSWRWRRRSAPKPSARSRRCSTSGDPERRCTPAAAWNPAASNTHTLASERTGNHGNDMKQETDTERELAFLCVTVFYVNAGKKSQTSNKR